MIFWLRGKRKADCWNVLNNVPVNVKKSSIVLFDDIIPQISLMLSPAYFPTALTISLCDCGDARI